ncbi:hypothetical protein HK405_006565 [Cladochytrium tenue]|nr:hypothetical protein HK405_006565 [Cladochytrium tenue]
MASVLTPNGVDEHAPATYPEAAPSRPPGRSARYYPVYDGIDYPLPIDVSEKDRLSLQHEITRYIFGGRLFNSPLAPATAGRQLAFLDVGCGPGHWVRDIANAYPDAKVVGADINPSFFEQAVIPPNLTFVECNILKGLPFPDNSFDLVFQRNMMAAIPKADWPAAVRELVRVTRPGGYVELMEPYSIMQRIGPAGKLLHEKMVRALNVSGRDSDIALRLDVHLDAAALQDIDEGTRSAPIGWGGRIGDLMLINMRLIYEGLEPLISRANGGIPHDEFAAMLDAMLDEFVERSCYKNWFYAYGRVPNSES